MTTSKGSEKSNHKSLINRLINVDSIIINGSEVFDLFKNGIIVLVLRFVKDDKIAFRFH